MAQEDNQSEAMEGVEQTEAGVENPLFTPEEQRILNLYERMEELQLEIALLKSQGTLSQGIKFPPPLYCRSSVLTIRR
jgi:hypothetical protein